MIRTNLLCPAIVTCGPLLGIAAAHAQTQPPSNSVVEEVVVTAQKRAENAQRVPISISAFAGKALEERAIDDIAALSNIAPNVTLDAGTPFSGSTAALGAFIRGIGQNDYAVNLDPGVGIYLDGVYLARTVGANVDLPDVERVEILKGPQGTLFGRNSVGGAISVVTRAPADQFGYRGDFTTGSYNRLDARGSVDLPLSDTVKSLLTYSVKTSNGYARRVDYASSTPYVTEPLGFQQTDFDSGSPEGGENQRSLRGKLQWTPTDALQITLSSDYSRINQTAIPTAVFAVVAGQGAFAGLAQNNIPGTALDVVTHTSGFNFAGLYNFCIGATDQQIAARNAQNLCGPRGTSLNPGGMLPSLAGVNIDSDPSNNRLPFDERWVTTDPDQSYATGNSFSRTENYGASTTIDFDLTDTVMLRSISAYRHLTFNAGIDADNSPLQILEVSSSMKQEQRSEELQLIGSAFADTLHYVLGAYYFQEDASALDYVTIAQGLLHVKGPTDLSTENYAFFGQLDWRVTDLVGITLGGRFTSEDKEFEAAQADLNGFTYKLFNCTVYGSPCAEALGFPSATEPLRYYIDETQKKSFENFSPKVGIQLYPTTDIMIYGSYARGYKTGGWTTRIQGPLDYAPDFGPEKAETFEAGLKSTWFGRRLQLNLAAFTTDYNGIQLNFQQGVSPTLQNAGTARIRGFELEAVAYPVGDLSVNAAIGFTDAKYTEVLPESVVAPNLYQAGVYDGAPLAKTPRWKFSFAPRYEIGLPNEGALVVLLDYAYISSTWNDTERTYALRRPQVDMLNPSITYREPKGRWDVTLGGTNALDERYPVNGLAQLSGGLIYGSYNPPAEWYLRLGMRF